MDVAIFTLYMYLSPLFEELYISTLYIEKCSSFKAKVFGLWLYHVRVHGKKYHIKKIKADLRVNLLTIQPP